METTSCPLRKVCVSLSTAFIFEGNLLRTGARPGLTKKVLARTGGDGRMVELDKVPN